jgi:two-component system OmpR family sensor kinase
VTASRASRPSPDHGRERAARRTRPRSLRWRIVAIVAILLTVTDAVVGVVTVVAFQGYLYGRLDDELGTASARALRAQDQLPSPPPNGADRPPSGGDPDHDFIGAPGQSADTVVAVYRSGTFVLAGYTDARGRQHRLGSAARAVLQDVPRDGTAVTRTLGTLGAYRVAATRSNGSVFITALPLGAIRSSIARLVLVVTGVGLVGVVAAAWSGAVLVRRALQPLSSVARTAAEVTTLDLDRGDAPIAVRVSSADIAASAEVGQVGTALNSLLGHVSAALAVRDRAETRVREFVADASHELRTPIATIRAYAELTARASAADPALPAAAVRGNVDRIGAESVRMAELVEELLLLARLDSAVPVRREPVDLSAMLVESAMDARAAGPDHRWELALGDEPVVVAGDPAPLRRVVVNLLANARVHTPAGTRVVASVVGVADGAGVASVAGVADGAGVGSVAAIADGAGSPGRTGGAARLVVENDGPAIPASAVPTLFERFTRADSSRTRSDDTGTTGLGLSIVRAVVVAHGGTVEVTSDDTATRFTVTLPGS